MFAPLGFLPGVTKEQIAAISRRGGWYEAGVPKVEHYIDLGGWFAGTPEEFVAFLKNLEPLSRHGACQPVDADGNAGGGDAGTVSAYRRRGNAAFQTLNADDPQHPVERAGRFYLSRRSAGCWRAC